MTHVLTPATYEVWLDDPDGNRICLLDNTAGFEYALVANDPGWFSMELPGTFDLTKIRIPDGIVEIWRGFGPGTLRLENAFFILLRERGSKDGNRFIKIAGPGVSELLVRRIVAYAAGSAQADQTDNTDDMAKEVVRDNLGADAAAGRNLASVGGGFAVQANVGGGPSITKAFSWKNVQKVVEEIAGASQQGGTELYFDIVPSITDAGRVTFQFQTWTGQRGADRTADSESPVFFGEQWGNLENPLYSEDYRNTVNYVYVGGPGEGASRETTEVSDSVRIGASIWNRREGFKDARNTEPGDTAARTTEGNQMLNQGRPRLRFSGDVVDTEQARYGRDWFFGDRVTAVDGDLQFDCMIKALAVKLDGKGLESIGARLEVEE